MKTETPKVIVRIKPNTCQTQWVKCGKKYEVFDEINGILRLVCNRGLARVGKHAVDLVSGSYDDLPKKASKNAKEIKEPVEEDYLIIRMP